MKVLGRYSLLIAVLILFGGASLPGFAQSIQGTVLGTITDPNGAVVPGAEIEVINVGTTFSRKVVTDELGDYRVPSLEPGTYRVVVVKQGFGRSESEPFSLVTNQLRRVDVKLVVGTTSTTVIVTGETGAAVETESATLSNLHVAKEFTELPLSIYGRSAFNILNVTAAVQSTGGIIVNGARDTANSFTIDGVGNDDTVSSRQAPNNMNLSVDGVQEVKVQTANNSAEYNQVSQFNAVSKSGKNQIHGSVFWGNFNSAFSARDFFDAPNQKASFENNNEFAATFGGPVYIPKLYDGHDKTFFFFSYGGQRYRIGNRGFLSVPTAAFRQGDFSAIAETVTIRDPQTGTPDDPATWLPFPGNIIPANRISPVSLALQNMLYPDPNRPGAGDFGVDGNYTSDPGGQFNSDVFSARVDQKISSRNTMFARVGITTHNQDVYPGFLNGGLDGSYVGNIPGKFVALSDTHAFSQSLVNEARMGFTRLFYTAYYGAPPGPDYVGQLGLGQLPNLTAMPGFSFSRFGGTAGTWIGSQAQNTFEWTDNLTWMRGKHAFKFGGDIRRYQVNNVNVPFDTTGSFSFDDAITGFDYASFLLGLPTYTSLATPAPANYSRSTSFGFYGQDDIKISPNLTLNVGMRYEYQTPWVDKFDRRYAFDPKTGSMVVAGSTIPSDLVPEVVATLPIITAQQAGLPLRSLLKADRNNWNPRLGIAYRPFGNDKTVVRLGYGWYTQMWPGLLTTDYGTGGPWQIDRSYDYQGGAPTQSFPNPFTANSSFQGVTGIQVVDPSIVNERAEQWNVSVGREIWGVAMDVAYVGTKTTRIPLKENLNLLQPSLLPYDPARQPYPRFDPLIQLQSRGQATYHGLTIQAVKRTRNGLSFNANYAFSKALTDSALNGYDPDIQQNQYALGLEKGPDPSVRKHQLRFSYTYELPVGHGKRFLSNANRLTDGFLGGWQVLGITTMLSGAYLSPRFSGVDPANTNQFSGRPDCIGNGNVGSMRDLIKAGLPMWDKNAFVVPVGGRGSYGNCGRGVLVGPGRQLWNGGVSKNIRFGETMRLQLQLEMFNMWNHANFGNGNTNIVSGNFGRTFSGGGGRKLLLGARIDF